MTSQSDLIVQLGGVQKAIHWAVELCTACIWRDFENQVAIELLDKVQRHRAWLKQQRDSVAKKYDLNHLPRIHCLEWQRIEVELTRRQAPQIEMLRIKQRLQQIDLERVRKESELYQDFTRANKSFPSIFERLGKDAMVNETPIDRIEESLLSHQAYLAQSKSSSYWAIVRDVVMNSQSLQGDRDKISACLRKLEEAGRQRLTAMQATPSAINPYRLFFMIRRMGKFIPRLFPGLPHGELTYWVSKHLRAMHGIKYNAKFVSSFQKANEKLINQLRQLAIQAERGMASDPDSVKYVRSSPLEILACFDGDLASANTPLSQSSSPINRLFLESLFLTGMVDVVHPKDFSERFATEESNLGNPQTQASSELDTKIPWRFYTSEPDTEYLLSVLFGIPVLETGLDDVFGGGVRLNDTGTQENEPNPALPGRVLMVRGGYGSGKTLLSLSLAASVARLGGLVFYIALEFDCEVVRFALARIGQSESKDRFVIVDTLESLEEFFKNRTDESIGAILVSSLPPEEEIPIKSEAILEAIKVFSLYRREVDAPRLIVVDPINSISQMGEHRPRNAAKERTNDKDQNPNGDREDLVQLRRKTLSSLRQATSFGANVVMIAEEDGTWTTFGEDIADVVIRLAFTRDRGDGHERRTLSVSKSRLVRAHRGPHPFRILSDQGIKVSLCSEAKGDSDRSRLFSSPGKLRFGFYPLDKILNPLHYRIAKFQNCGSLILIEGVLGTFKTQFGLAFLSAPLLKRSAHKRPVGLAISMRYDDESMKIKRNSIECSLMIQSEAQQLRREAFTYGLCDFINDANRSVHELDPASKAIHKQIIYRVEQCILNSVYEPVLRSFFPDLQSNRHEWRGDVVLQNCNIDRLMPATRNAYQEAMKSSGTSENATRSEELLSKLRKLLFENTDYEREIRTCTLPTGYVFPGEILDRIKQEFDRVEREDARIDRVFLDNPGEWEDMCPLLSEDAIFADTLISFLRRRNVRILVTNRMVGSEDSKVIRAIVERVDTKIQLEQQVVGGRQTMLLHVARSPKNNHDNRKFEIHPNSNTGLSFRPVESFKRFDENGRVLPLPVHILARRQSEGMSKYWENVGALIKASIASNVEYSETGSYGHRFAFHLSTASAFDSLRLVEIDEFELQTADTFLAPLDPADFSKQLTHLKHSIRQRIDVRRLRAIPFFDNTSYLVVRKSRLMRMLEQAPTELTRQLPPPENAEARCRMFLSKWEFMASLARHLSGTAKKREEAKQQPFFSFASREPENWNCLFLEILASIDSSIQWNSKQCLSNILTEESTRPGSVKELRPTVVEASRILWDLLASERSPSCPNQLKEPFDVANSNAILSRNWFTALHPFRLQNFEKADAPSEDPTDNIGDLMVCRLPGAFSVSGQWYLGLLQNSAAIDVGVGLLQQLTSRKAEEDRLRTGLGLPTTKPPKPIPPARDWSRIHDTDYFENSHVNVLDRSSITNYLDLNHLLSRSLTSLVLLPEFDEGNARETWKLFLSSIEE